MLSGWNYRIASVLGVAQLTMLAVLLANFSTPQFAFTTYIPVFWNLDPTVLYGSDLWLALTLPTALVVGWLYPLYKPRPRRVLDIVFETQKRVVVATCALAALGYFNYSYRLPRSTLIMTSGMLLVFLPAWFVTIRHRPTSETERAIIVGDDLDSMGDILAVTDLPVIGYVSPPLPQALEGDRHSQITVTDGGGELSGVPCLGGLSRLDEVFVEHDVDTAILDFAQPDRAEFFGALDTCYEYGITAKVHRKHADSLLTTGFGSGELVDVDLEPWDMFEHMAKRGFDAVFSAVGLLLSVPLVCCIAVAIKLDDGGSVLYRQERTASLGDTFTIYKFRTMVENVEDATPVSDAENPYITRVGAFLRRTHLDELPQLWSILVGDMSVVGPRAAWIDEEFELETEATDWRKRWFVKPGLTGLAQINGVSSTEPAAKLRYDIEYIRRQSFGFDLKIVLRQIWKVLLDLRETIR